MTGKLIVLDGADGAGKATQAKLLVERLQQDGGTVESMDFPRYTENFFGQYIREWLDGKYGNFVELDPRLASVLLAADRFEAKETLNQWLNDGATVVLDRYASSNILHQGAKIFDDKERFEFFQWLERMEYGVFGIPRPDLVIYLDIPAKTRQGLLFGDATRTTVDVAEASLDHQLATDRCANQVISHNQWCRINCVIDGELRSIEDIHAEVYEVTQSELARA